MKQLNKLRLCLFLNSCLVVFIGFYITNFAAESKYFRFGPNDDFIFISVQINTCLLYTSPSPRDRTRSRMPSSA